MGRAPCCSKVGLHRGPWSPREDTLLTNYIQVHGEGNWRSLPKEAGLLRCGKSCRLRWMNYLRPDIKRGNITPDEDDLIIRLHSLLGNRWSLIAGRLPGRTDNEIKNYWNTHLSKKLRNQGSNLNIHKKLSERVLDSRKRNITKLNRNNNNKKKQMNKKNPNLETEKPKIHQPRPVRVTSFSLPRNESFESSRSSHGDYYQDHNGGFVPWTTSNFNGVRFFIRGGDDDQDHDHFVNGSDFECQSYAPTIDKSTLEKLYDEYLQLLETEEDQEQLDTFAESLLI